MDTTRKTVDPALVRDKIMHRSPSGFRSPKGEARYVDAYDATLASWPVAFNSLQLATRYGDTHVIASGPEDAPPLLLLHAASFSATEWLANIAALSQRFRTYAVDILGEPGKSVQTRPLQSRADVGDWLLDVLDKLEIDRASMVGHSFGGWMTVSFALRAPERLNKIVLLAPAASIHRFSWPTRLALGVGRLMWMLPSRLVVDGTLKKVFAQPENVNPAFLEQFAIGVKEFRYPKNGVFPSACSDLELLELSVPTLLLIGDKEGTYPPEKALDRAGNLIPNLQAELISGAGHGLNIDQPELVNSRMVEFLAGSTE